MLFEHFPWIQSRAGSVSSQARPSSSAPFWRHLVHASRSHLSPLLLKFFKTLYSYQLSLNKVLVFHKNSYPQLVGKEKIEVIKWDFLRYQTSNLNQVEKRAISWTKSAVIFVRFFPRDQQSSASVQCLLLWQCFTEMSIQIHEKSRLRWYGLEWSAPGKY